MDLGGQWVHGQTGNTAYELANPLGLLDASDRPDFGLALELFDSKGNPIAESITQKLWHFLLAYVHDAEFDKNTPYESIGDYAEKM